MKTNLDELDLDKVDLVKLLQNAGFTDEQVAAIIIVSTIQSGRIVPTTLNRITDNINANTVKVKNTTLN